MTKLKKPEQTVEVIPKVKVRSSIRTRVEEDTTDGVGNGLYLYDALLPS